MEVIQPLKTGYAGFFMPEFLFIKIWKISLTAESADNRL